MKIRPVEVELFHPYEERRADGRKGRQTWRTIKGTFSLSHQYINTFYNSYRLHVSAYYSHLQAYVIRAV